jgi:hypothetical protein
MVRMDQKFDQRRSSGTMVLQEPEVEPEQAFRQRGGGKESKVLGGLRDISKGARHITGLFRPVLNGSLTAKHALDTPDKFSQGNGAGVAQVVDLID